MSDIYDRYSQLEICRSDISKALEIMISCYENKGKLLVCGNGGSCADGEHIVGELMKGFMQKRALPDEECLRIKSMFPDDGEYICSHLQGALPAIALTSQSAIISAFSNDVAPDMTFAQMVYGYGCDNDMLVAISTSGNSVNVVNAAKVAAVKGMKIIALTGAKKCRLDDIADCIIHVPETETYKIQELHLPVYHYLCAECEKHFFKEI